MDLHFSKEKLQKKCKAFRENDFVDALIQALFIFFFSNLPYLIVLIFVLLQPSTGNDLLSEFFQKAFQNFRFGEILILISALLAPFVYVMHLYKRSNANMPFFYLFVVLLCSLYLVSIIMFCMERFGQLPNHDPIKKWALGLYGTAIIVWYFGMVFQRKLPKIKINGGQSNADRMAVILSQEANHDV
jgi:magnesium-transporting ATPase (P-type)